MVDRVVRLAGPVAITVALVTVLLSLGAWQIERLAWKQALLTQIAAANRLPPVQLGHDVPALFTRVSVHGTLVAPAAFYGAEVRGEGGGARMGAQLLQVLERLNEPPILVDLGWVPLDKRSTNSPILGETDLVGYIRTPEKPSWLTASEDLEDRHFYALDPTEIGTSLGRANVAPMTLVTLGSAKPGLPQPATALPDPVNNHLSYALTWFGLAATLIGVFGAWLRKRLAETS